MFGQDDDDFGFRWSGNNTQEYKTTTSNVNNTNQTTGGGIEETLKSTIDNTQLVATFQTAAVHYDDENTVEQFEESDDENETLLNDLNVKNNYSEMFALTSINVHDFSDFKIKQLEVVNNLLFILTEHHFLLFASDGTCFKKYTIRYPVYRMFVHPNGMDIILNATIDGIFYINLRWKERDEPIKLPTKDPLFIGAIGWSTNIEDEDEDNIGEILIATNEYKLHICSIRDDRIDNMFLAIDLKSITNSIAGEITHITVDTYYDENGDRKMVILMATPTQLFHFYGGPNFTGVFHKYKSMQPKVDTFIEFSGRKREENSKGCLPSLATYKSSTNHEQNLQSEAFVWLSTNGVYHGNFNFNIKKIDQCPIKEPELIHFGGVNGEFVKAVACTQYHLFVLFDSKLSIYMQPPGVSQGLEQLNDQPIKTTVNSLAKLVKTYEKKFQTKEKPVDLLMDYSDETKESYVYVYTTDSVYRIDIKNEGKKAWEIYLIKAVRDDKLQFFNKAQDMVQDNEEKLNICLTTQANYHFDKGQYKDAAMLYYLTTGRFEEITLKFLELNAYDALRIYIEKMIELFDYQLTVNCFEKNSDNPYAVPLRCMSTWLVDLYLQELDEHAVKVRRTTDQQEKADSEFLMRSCQNKLRDFMKSYASYLDQKTTFNLISLHGHADDSKYYASQVENYEKLINYCIAEQHYEEAIQVLSMQVKSSFHSEIFYTYAPKLVVHLPKKTFNLLRRKTFLLPEHLIPTLMRYLEVYYPNLDREEPSNLTPLEPNGHKPENKKQGNLAIKYLFHCLDPSSPTASANEVVHNLLILLFAQQDEDMTQVLLEGKYNKQFALSICSHYNRTEACIILYKMMRMTEQAIMLALQIGKIDQAKNIVRQLSEKQQPLYWNMIAKHVIRSQVNIENVVRVTKELLKETNLLDVYSVLRHFPDFSTMNHVRDILVEHFKRSRMTIESMVQETNIEHRNKQHLDKYYNELDNRHTNLDINGECSCHDCTQPIFTSGNLYIFPCHHKFHASCLQSLILNMCESGIRKEMDLALSKEDEGSDDEDDLDDEDNVDTPSLLQQKLREKLDHLHSHLRTKENIIKAGDVGPLYQDVLQSIADEMAEECPYCGDFLISSINIPFCTDDDAESQAIWSISHVDGQFDTEAVATNALHMDLAEISDDTSSFDLSDEDSP